MFFLYILYIEQSEFIVHITYLHAELWLLIELNKVSNYIFTLMILSVVSYALDMFVLLYNYAYYNFKKVNKTGSNYQQMICALQITIIQFNM